MVAELKLPAPEGRVYFYSDLGAYQAALTTEYKTHLHWPEGESREIKQRRNQLEVDLVKHALEQARYTGAITIGQKVFVAEGAWAARFPWRSQIRTLM
jgi:hypothetical protein